MDFEDDSPAGEESRADAIYRALVKAMVSRDLVPGMKLSETDISDAFNVSRTIVRAVLNRLQSESLAEFRNKRGAFVASPSATEARQIFDLRKLLERTVVSRLAETITASQIGKLEALAALHLEHRRSGLDTEAMHAAGEFHLELARMLGHGVIQTTLSRLVVRSALVLALYDRHNASECSINEHHDIIEALRGHDPIAAAAAMDKHLDDIARHTQPSQDDREPASLSSILAPHLRQVARLRQN